MDEDLQAVEQIKAGQAQAFAILVRKYQARVRGYCLGVFHNTATADDAAQEVFIKAYKGLANFKGKSSFGTWLYRIMVNHCRDLLRKKGRDSTVSWDALEEAHGEQGAHDATVVKQGVSAEQKAMLQMALKQLPEDYRELLLLREVQGLSYDELTQAVGCTLDSVKSKLKRARQQLATIFKGMQDGTSLDTRETPAA